MLKNHRFGAKPDPRQNLSWKNLYLETPHNMQISNMYFLKKTDSGIQDRKLLKIMSGWCRTMLRKNYDDKFKNLATLM